ncbi:hypothetical protein [Methylobacterium sp. WL6]|uniref:hypothetical protein n=1 Tax=Methylobacterium sp. WL6 TaxID=2603901 RepID=UPI0011C852D9|nr:hypothetical protein [Methylobacterium sp. WL6]TXN66328.1 hypothetical protein FV230_15675 [Methylobacterium sp. WL6]
MLQSNRRHILFFDLSMSPHPSDAPPIPLESLIKPLEKMVSDNECFQVLDNEKRIIRLSRLKMVSLPSGKQAVAMLFNLGDKRKS